MFLFLIIKEMLHIKGQSNRCVTLENKTRYIITIVIYKILYEWIIRMGLFIFAFIILKM